MQCNPVFALVTLGIKGNGVPVTRRVEIGSTVGVGIGRRRRGEVYPKSKTSHTEKEELLRQDQATDLR